MRVFAGVLVSIVLLALLACAGWFLYSVAVGVVGLFTPLGNTERVTLITAFVTVLASTFTVMLGRSYDKRRELNAILRDKKTPIYDKFLSGLLPRFQGDTTSADDTLLPFLKEWHREIILWGGTEVVTKYTEWMRVLKAESSHPTARTLFLLEDVIRAIRKELGHNDWRLKKGTFIRFVMREADLFFASVKTNPAITLAELATLERQLEERMAKE